MQGRTITSRGIELFTESAGGAGDPAVLLIMGAMASGVWWPEETASSAPTCAACRWAGSWPS